MGFSFKSRLGSAVVITIIYFFLPIICLEDNISKSDSKFFLSVIENKEPELSLVRSKYSTTDIEIKKICIIPRREWLATARTILGHNPYFCNSFAILGIDYLQPLSTDLISSVLSFQYLISDTKNQAFSIGGGARYSSSLCSTLGFNLFYDWKYTPLHRFYQIGLGVEYLRFINCTSLLELRANLYLPVNKHFLAQKKYIYYPEEFLAVGTNNINNPGGWQITLGRRFFL